MMGVLTQFLKEKAERLRAERPERQKLVDDWTRAVTRLMNQLETWVKEADTERLLDVRRTHHHFNDEKMGPYAVDGLDITLDGQTVSVVPVARRVVASVQPPGEPTAQRAEGRVDLKRYGDTMYVLYRLTGSGDDRWYVVHSGAWDAKRQQPIVKPLDRGEFELDLLSLFE